MVTFDTCPVGARNCYVEVERRIRHIRESLDKSCQNERLSILQWETTSSEIAIAKNDLPLALCNSSTRSSHSLFSLPATMKIWTY